MFWIYFLLPARSLLFMITFDRYYDSYLWGTFRTCKNIYRTCICNLLFNCFFFLLHYYYYFHECLLSPSRASPTLLAGCNLSHGCVFMLRWGALSARTADILTWTNPRKPTWCSKNKNNVLEKGGQPRILTASSVWLWDALGAPKKSDALGKAFGRAVRCRVWVGEGSPTRPLPGVPHEFVVAPTPNPHPQHPFAAPTQPPWASSHTMQNLIVAGVPEQR